MLDAGKKAPDFTLLDQDGSKVKLSSFRGKKVVLYFYPRDMTPGCTKQACNLRDNHADLKKAGIVVLGVSPDAPERHTKFIAKYELPFTLLADPECKVLEKYGVWGEKKLYGRTFLGVKRTTYLIDETGKIVEVIKKPKVGEHTAQVLDGFSG